ncbi:uncharacterized protein si:ch73-140j24.4 isoform X2 [Pimephales promelas]|nr:uncharacterized protein si:ch73-140j24.4 isoform X2 [Pimephales promelas]
MEQETLQTVKALCRNTQESMEKLEERKTQLKEELKVIYDLQKQEREVLQCLQEEQQDLEQTVQQYDTELCAAAEDLLQIQREVAYAKAHAESLHEQITPLQDVFEEIVQVKKKLGELVAGLITGESAMTEMTEEADCVGLDQELVGKVDVVESECDHVYCEKIVSKQEREEVDYVEQESTPEELEKMQYSTENLKSSGSSSFTEITLTEVKEEDVMFRSTTPQSDSSDMEKEDFEIIQPSQATNRQFDFFHPNPFTYGDVFGEDHFPKVDVTEQLPRDPFKGIDPFASDTLLVNMPEENHCQDDFITAENSLLDTVQSSVKDYGTFNTPIKMPLVADFKQSTGDLDCVSMSTENRSLESCSDANSGVQINVTQDQNHDAVQPDLSKEAQFNEECVHESGSSHSSTVFNSFDADSSIFAEAEELEDRVEVQDGFIKRANSLCGLQRIIAGSYTGFPLSPCDPEPLPGISVIEKIFEQHISSEQNAGNDKDRSHSELTESLSSDNSPGPLCEQLHDINSNASTSPSICASQPSALDVNDYKYGDMYFFTVRLDPGSPELHNHSPVCPEPNEIKKEESHEQLPWKDPALSAEFNEIDDFECCSPKPEDTEQHSQITEQNDQNNFENVEQDITINSDPPKGNEVLGSDSERVDLQIPCLTVEDSDACQSLSNSEWNDQWNANLPAAEHVPDSSFLDKDSSTPNSPVQDLFCLESKTDADASATDQVYVCEQLVPESSSFQQHSPACSETLAMSKFELQYFDPFSPIPAEPVDCVSESEEFMNVVHEPPRLDSGYHEVDTPAPFSPEPTYKSKYSIDLQGQGLETSKQSNSEIHVPDPFSPESVDTGIFDSETENCDSGNIITKFHFFSPQQVHTDLNNPEDKQSFINTVSCDMLSDHLSGSELDDCYPFGSCPSNEESYAYSSEENVITGPIRDGSDVSGQYKPNSMVSNECFNQVIHSDSEWSTSVMSLPNPEAFDPMKNNFFDFNSPDVGSFVTNISQEAEEATHCAGKVTKKADLTEIDYFCTELSKMVSSSSSDSVQQSVAEMLFGSDPDTSSFYPWDFEKQQHSC